MTFVCGLDIETTGLSHETDHVTELAWIIREVGNPKDFVMQTRFVEIPNDHVISDEITRLTKITSRHLAGARDLQAVVGEMCTDMDRYGVKHIVAHNGEGFDKPFLLAQLAKVNHGFATAFHYMLANKMQWIDTAVDCVYPEFCRYTNLMYVAAHFGFVNPFPHSALFDVATMMRVLEHFDFAEVEKRAREPWVFVKAQVTFDEKDLAKARRYYWENFGDRKFPKTWVKRIKESDVAKEQAEAGFPVQVIG